MSAEPQRQCPLRLADRYAATRASERYNWRPLDCRSHGSPEPQQRIQEVTGQLRVSCQRNDAWDSESEPRAAGVEDDEGVSACHAPTKQAATPPCWQRQDQLAARRLIDDGAGPCARDFAARQ